MKKLQEFLFGILILFSVSCGGDSKQLLIMASGTFEVSDNTIKLEPGTRHNEQTITLDSDKIKVESGDGTKEISVNEGGGLYILNLKTDTIVGSYQRIGEYTGSEKITQEDLRNRIDSLDQLTKGLNVKKEKRNFFIPPYQVAKISENSKAEVVGPYLKMPESFKPGKEYEMYKFYTNKEVYEIIGKLRPMAVDTLRTGQ